jgi:carbon storage regulator
MLILSRKAGQTLHVGDDVVITVVKTSRNKVSLGIEAPEDVQILRGELERWDDDVLRGGSSASHELDLDNQPSFAAA